MQKWKIVCMLLVLSVVSKVKAQESYDQRVKNYIEHYKDWAMEEQRRSGVPAAITLAQGIHETSAGTSELALNANNHFGIKCKKEWNGETYAYTDDAPDECFRKYPSAFQSYKDHSDYLAGSQRYASLFKLSAKDYSGWCVGLKRCGYATNPKYSQILIKLIEQYNLQQYTYAALSDDYNPVEAAAQQEQKAAGVMQRQQAAPEEDARPAMSDVPTQQTSPLPQSKSKKSGMSVSYGATAQVVKKNEDDEYVPADDPQNPEYGKLVKVAGLKAFYAKKGTVLLEDAFRFNIRYSKLLEINELPDLPLHADMYIFLEKKNPKGIHETHMVAAGETLSIIAQSEAMQLRYLKYYNHIGANEEPVAGAVLQLQHYSDNKPATVVKDVAPAEAEPETFAGSHPGAIPQGATRMRAGYISKKEIRAAEKEEVAKAKTAKVEEEEVQVPEEQPNAEKQTPEIIDEPKKDAPEMASAIVDEPVKSEEVKNEKVAIDTAMQTAEANVTATVTPVEDALKSDTTEAFASADTTAPATVAKKEDIEYDVVQPEPIVENNKKDVAETVSAIEQPKEEPRQADTIESVPPVAATIAPVAKETTTVKAPEKVSLPVEEPKDEYAKLKARLDKVVYASDNTIAEVEKPKKEEEKKPVGTKRLENTKKEVAADPAANKKDASKFYTVKKGDTAFSIAKKNNITMRQLMDWNKLDFKTIKVGQELRVK